MTQPRGDAGLHPKAGARFLFERQSESDDHQSATYRAAIYTPEQCFEYLANMTLEGGHDIIPNPGSATQELESKLGKIATLIARSAKKKLANQLPPWPHRVLRWRGPGRG